MNATLESPQQASTSQLVPGNFYTVVPCEEDPIKNTFLRNGIHPSLYARQEYLEGRDWHVFAALWPGPILSRVRFPTQEPFKISYDRVFPSTRLTQKLIINPREERAPSVNTFIDEAYRLVRSGISGRTLKQDAYDLAERGYAEEARLRIVIQQYHERNS